MLKLFIVKVCELGYSPLAIILNRSPLVICIRARGSAGTLLYEGGPTNQNKCCIKSVGGGTNTYMTNIYKII